MRQVLIGSVAVSMAANVFGAFWLGKDGWERTGRHGRQGQFMRLLTIPSRLLKGDLRDRGLPL